MQAKLAYIVRICQKKKRERSGEVVTHIWNLSILVADYYGFGASLGMQSKF